MRLHIARNEIRREMFRLALVLAPLMAAGPSRAEDPSAKSVLKAPVSSPAPAAEPGRLLILVFRDGLPVPGIEILGSFGSRVTNEDGVVSVELPAGRSEVGLPANRGAVPVNVVSGGETEVVINLAVGKADFDIAAPEAASATSVPELTATRADAPLVLRMTDQRTGAPLAAAAVRVAGYRGQVLADKEGRVELRLPDGKHEFLVTSEGYSQQTRSLDVGADRAFDFKLRPAEGELEEFVVLAPRNQGSVAALVEVRRRSAAVTEVLGAEQMSRQGDSDAAASLRRVTGLTLMGGKYVYVRGLGERYSGVQMNGLFLPSPEPARRVVPLDLFPTSVLESVVVQKSYTPDLPGEFGGGLIQLRTRRLPERFFARVSLSSEFNDLGDRLTTGGGGTDWIGRDNGSRAMPASIRDALKSGRRLIENNPPSVSDGFSPGELQALGRSLSDNYDTDRTSTGLPPGLALAAGSRWNFEGWSLGAAGSLLNGTSGDVVEQTTRKFNVGAGGALESDEDARTEKSEIERKFGASLDVGADLGADHRLSLGGLYVMNSTDTTQVKEYTQRSSSVGGYRKTNIEWAQRELFTTQLIGQHRFASGLAKEKTGVEWRLGRSLAKRDAPDQREYVYYLKDKAYELNTDTTGNRRVFEELGDNGNEAAIDLTVPIDSSVVAGIKMKTGLSRQERDRRSDAYRLHFRNRFRTGQTPDLTQGPDEVFSEPNRNPDGWVLTNLTESADSYSGEQVTEAAYLMSEIDLNPRWSLVTGVRAENSRQIVRTFYYYDPSSPTSEGGMKTSDLLPSHSLVWKPNDSVRVRLAYSETLARPDFRELSTVPFIDNETGYEVVGNSRLRGTVIRNIDHRWEYYFNPDEYLSAGVFFKRFESPIEEVFEPSPNLRKTFENADSADNRGLELEGRVGLRRLSRGLRRWMLLGNLSLIDSKVRLADSSRGIQTTSDRPLQGQSPYVLNLQMQYDRPLQGTTATLLYNVIGPRITEVGTAGRPDILEQPFHQIDLTATQKIGGTASLAFKAKNLLDPEVKATQGDETVRSLRRGRDFSITLAMSL